MTPPRHSGTTHGCRIRRHRESVRTSTVNNREVAQVRHRPLGHVAFPYAFFDSTHVKAWVNHAVASRAVKIFMGVTVQSGHKVLGVDIDDSEEAMFWAAFLTGRKARAHMRRFRDLGRATQPSRIDLRDETGVGPDRSTRST